VPRALSPWTWARALRDHGPNDRDFLCAMLILRTYMDNAGFAYPSLRTWAGATRMAVNTLRVILGKATAEGWLHVESRAGNRRQRVRNVYRCTVPGHIEVSDKDEEIAGALVAIHGDVPRMSSGHSVTGSVTEPARSLPESLSVSSMRDTDSSAARPSVSRIPNTDARRMANAWPNDGERHAHDTPSVSSTPSICINSPADLCQKQGASVSAMVDTEVLKSKERSLYEGAGASARTASAPNVSSKGENQKPEGITDAQLWQVLNDIGPDHEYKVSTMTKILSARYLDVTEGRLWRVIRAEQAKRNRPMVV
jgi:hypothetical protein